MRKRHTALLVLLLSLITPGCVALLGIGAGVVISQDMVDNSTYVAQLKEDVNVAWAIAKSSASHQASKPIETDEDLRVITATIDEAVVTISVEAYDMNQTRLQVSAKKFAVANGEIAEMVFNRILKRMAQ